MVASNLITGKGNEIFVNIMLLAGGESSKPTPFQVTPTADLAVDDETMTLTAPLAIGENIAKGQPIVFPGGLTDIRQVVFAAEEYVGDGAITEIAIRPCNGVITAAAADVGFTRMQGGTNLERNFGTTTLESTIHEDEGAYQISTVQNKNLTFPWTGNISPSYVSFWLMQEINDQAEARVWAEVVVTKPRGFAVGLTLENVCIVGEYNDTWPADGICEYNVTFNNQGTPQFSQPRINAPSP